MVAKSYVNWTDYVFDGATAYLLIYFKFEPENLPG